MAIIEIHAGPAHLIKNNELFLSQRFNKEQLLAILLDLRKVFSGESLIFFNSNGIRCPMPAEANALRKKGNILKKELMQCIGFFLSDRRNILAYFNCLDAERQKLIERVLRNYFIDAEDAESLVPGLLENVQSFNPYYFYSTVPYVDRLPWLNIFNPSGYFRHSGKKDCCLAFDRGLHRCFASAILPEVWRVYESTLPEDKIHFNAEPEMGRLLMMVAMLDANGQLKMNQNKLADSVVKRISSASGIAEFLPASDKGFASLRAILMLNFFAYASPGKNSDFRKMFETFINEVAHIPSVFFSLLGRHIRGLSSKYRKASPGVLINKMVDVLRTFGREKPVSVEQYVKEIIMNDEVGAMTFFNLSDIYYSDIENKMTGCEIKPVNIVPEVTMSFVYGFVALLASLGGAEIWYDTPERDCTSYFSFISHFRLTPLGEYMLGFRDKYEAPEADGLKMELNPDSLIITLPSDTSPFGGVLSAMAERIGPGRYFTSDSMMLNGCQTSSDIADRLNFFRKTAKEMPANWTQFFKRLLDRCQPLKAENLGKLHMFSISPENIDLQRLLSTDPFLKTMVIRAEGYRILVYDDDLIRFKERLRQLGYLF